MTIVTTLAIAAASSMFVAAEDSVFFYACEKVTTDPVFQRSDTVEEWCCEVTDDIEGPECFDLSYCTQSVDASDESTTLCCDDDPCFKTYTSALPPLTILSPPAIEESIVTPEPALTTEEPATPIQEPATPIQEPATPIQEPATPIQEESFPLHLFLSPEEFGSGSHDPEEELSLEDILEILNELFSDFQNESDFGFNIPMEGDYEGLVDEVGHHPHMYDLQQLYAEHKFHPTKKEQTKVTYGQTIPAHCHLRQVA